MSNSLAAGRTVPDAPALVTIPEDQREAARRTVARFAVDTGDAARLMLALGIYPGQEDMGFQIPDSYRFSWCT